jgi:hypothetical protein
MHWYIVPAPFLQNIKKIVKMFLNCQTKPENIITFSFYKKSLVDTTNKCESNFLTTYVGMYLFETATGN